MNKNDNDNDNDTPSTIITTITTTTTTATTTTMVTMASSPSPLTTRNSKRKDPPHPQPPPQTSLDDSSSLSDHHQRQHQHPRDDDDKEHRMTDGNDSTLRTSTGKGSNTCVGQTSYKNEQRHVSNKRHRRTNNNNSNVDDDENDAKKTNDKKSSSTAAAAASTSSSSLPTSSLLLSSLEGGGGADMDIIQLDEELEARIYVEQTILQLEQKVARKDEEKKHQLQQQQQSAASLLKGDDGGGDNVATTTTIIPEGFDWASYPMLEDFLCREARAFFKSQHQQLQPPQPQPPPPPSGKPQQRKSQQHQQLQQQQQQQVVEYNESLTLRIRTIARRHGYCFVATMDNRKLRYAVKLYYQTAVDQVLQKHVNKMNATGGQCDDTFRAIMMGLQQLQKKKNKISNNNNNHNINKTSNSPGETNAAAAPPPPPRAKPRAAAAATASHTTTNSSINVKDRNEALHCRLQQVVFQSPPQKKKPPQRPTSASTTKRLKEVKKNTNYCSSKGSSSSSQRNKTTAATNKEVAKQGPKKECVYPSSPVHDGNSSNNGSVMGGSDNNNNHATSTAVSTPWKEKMRPCVSIPNSHGRIHKLWMRVKEMMGNNTNGSGNGTTLFMATEYPSIPGTLLSCPRDVSVWRNVQTLQAMIHVHLAANRPNLAMRLCHDELTRLYQAAIHLLPLFMSTAQATTASASASAALPLSASATAQLVAIRDKLAATWCLYAQTCADIAGMFNSSSCSADSNSSSKSSRVKANSDGNSSTNNMSDEASTMSSSSIITSSWLDSAFSALSLAVGCRLVGNHAYVTMALARLLLLHWSGCSNLSGRELTNESGGLLLDAERQTTIKNTLETAFDICKDGIDRARAVYPFEPRQDIYNDSVNSQQHLDNLSQLLSTVGAEMEVSLKAGDEQEPHVTVSCTVETLVASMAHIVHLKSCVESAAVNVGQEGQGQAQAQSPQYLFVDKKSIRSLCHELNHLSHISEVLVDDKNKTATLNICKADGKKHVASSCGLGILYLFQPLDVVVSVEI